MKKIAIIIYAFFVLTAFTTTVITWKSDKPHSQLGFTITHLGIADVSGTFNDFDVIVTGSKKDFSDASLNLPLRPLLYIQGLMQEIITLKVQTSLE